MLLVNACATNKPVPSSTPISPTEESLTQAPRAANTPEPPPLFEITFDGSECKHSIPSELEPGKYSFVLHNITEADIKFWPVHIDEGFTIQDFRELQSEPGEWFGLPRWAQQPPKLAQRWDESLGGLFYTFLMYEAGGYSTAVGSINPDRLWLCPPFQVFEASPE